MKSYFRDSGVKERIPLASSFALISTMASFTMPILGGEDESESLINLSKKGWY